MSDKCNNYDQINCLEDLCDKCEDKYSALLEAAVYLLEAYVEENGGSMPSNDPHPAHAMQKALDALGEEL